MIGRCRNRRGNTFHRPSAPRVSLLPLPRLCRATLRQGLGGKGWDENRRVLTNVLQAKPETIARMSSIPDLDRRIYAAMVVELDEAIGQVLAALGGKRLGGRHLGHAYRRLTPEGSCQPCTRGIAGTPGIRAKSPVRR